MGTENKESCSQRDSAERKGYVRAHRSFNRIWKERDSAELDILGKILNKDNLNRAYKRVKANKGAPGVDGMTVEEAFAVAEGTQSRTDRTDSKGTLYPIAGQKSGDSEAGWRNTKAWHSYRHRPHHSTGNDAATDTDLRAKVFGWKFRISSGAKCERCSSEDKGVRRTGIYKGGSP